MEITEKLNLTSPLRLSKARECYATTLFRAGKSVDKICDMMGQSTVTVTKNHYVGSMDANEIFEMNDVLY